MTTAQHLRSRWRLLAAGAASLALAGSLSGCSALQNAVERTHEERFENLDAAQTGWVGVRLPEWLPDDSTEIRNLATADEGNSVMRVSSSSDPAGDCVEGERRGLPFDEREWVPQVEVDEPVLVCGDYEVVAVDGGWMGWFNKTEAGQTPGD